MAVSGAGDRFQELKAFDESKAGVKGLVTAGITKIPRIFAVYYTRESGKRVNFRSNFDLYESPYANWRDTLFCVMGPDPLDPQELPECPENICMPPNELAEDFNHSWTLLQLPVVDLSGIERGDRRLKIINEVQHASEKWGFSQGVNHGIPVNVLDQVIDGKCMLH
ncbi:hypothetical protein RJ639_044030 [Escallonia herrerae]|uniref:Non-haem dioxygenase N-terminal domain-containing protein n=1 Tax=Escallonia herrerae TaxID=1293975 RepID=A0AA88WG85_9ASTE|nr:hypothetical protein RJ639_044030 [Escallonia herrerae]